MATTKSILKSIQDDYGEAVASEGVELVDETRIATGVFPFDLATGGGFPEGRISVVYGPESSLKTTIVLKAIANMQLLHPEKTCVFIDVEVAYNPEWGAKLGVDNDKLYYVIPDYAEQAVDIAEAFMYADDVGIVAIDSLAALITANEVDSSAEKAVVGGSGLVVGKLYRKVTLALGKAMKEGRKPTFIAINQIRYKIGVMFGDPEVMPGGVAFKFASSLTVRMYGKDELDKKISAVLPAWKLCTGIIKKYRVPIVARTFKFKLATMANPSKGLIVGMVSDWNTLFKYLKEFDMLVKIKNGYTLSGTTFKTQVECKEAMLENPEWGGAIRAEVIKLAIEKGHIADDESE